MQGVVERFLMNMDADALRAGYITKMQKWPETHAELCTSIIQKAKSNPFRVLEKLKGETVIKLYRKRAGDDVIDAIDEHAARVSIMGYWQQV